MLNAMLNRLLKVQFVESLPRGGAGKVMGCLLQEVR